jgi:CheY-like chemotaxis protein
MAAPGVDPVGVGTHLIAATRLPAAVCDDDPVARGVIAVLLQQAGFDVIAEIATARDVPALLDARPVSELVVDLRLNGSHGTEVLRSVRERDGSCRATVFSAFAEDPAMLLASGATAVIHKPDFDALVDVLARDATRLGSASSRRPAVPDRSVVARPHVTAPSGFAPPTELEPMVDLLAPGDAILVLDLDGLDPVEHRRATLARAVTSATRATDVLAVTERGVLVVLLLDPSPDTPLAVYERVTRSWDDRNVGGAVRAAAVVCDEHPPRRALARALGQLRDGVLGVVDTWGSSAPSIAVDG